MKHLEFLFEDREYSISVGPLDYFIQDQVEQWWLAALVSEAGDNFMLKALLRRHGVVNTTSPVNSFVRKLRQIILEEAEYSHALITF